MARQVAIVSLAFVVPEDFPRHQPLGDRLRALADLWDKTPYPEDREDREVDYQYLTEVDQATVHLWEALGNALDSGCVLGFAVSSVHPDDYLGTLGFPKKPEPNQATDDRGAMEGQ